VAGQEVGDRPTSALGDELQDGRRWSGLAGFDEVNRLPADLGAGNLGQGQASVQACFLYRARFNVNARRAPYRLGLDAASLTQVMRRSQAVK
jgi:hypothetical protein